MDRTNFIHILYTFFDALTLFSKLSCYTSNQLNFIYYKVEPILFFLEVKLKHLVYHILVSIVILYFLLHLFNRFTNRIP